MGGRSGTAMTTTEDDSGPANPHYVDHVVATAAARGIEACEHIVASNGTKLVAKGTRIDAQMRERLLQHKLSKPLEEYLAARMDAGARGRRGRQRTDGTAAR
jgi:hypothetical protein